MRKSIDLRNRQESSPLETVRQGLYDVTDLFKCTLLQVYLSTETAATGIDHFTLALAIEFFVGNTQK